jgi:hypothetical protein
MSIARLVQARQPHRRIGNLALTHSAWLRDLDEYERQLVGALIARVGQHRDVYEDQVLKCKVRSLDPNGSLEFVIFSDRRADHLRTVPVEGEALDADNIGINYLLHVVDGKIALLNIYKDDISHIVRKPPIGQITIR